MKVSIVITNPNHHVLITLPVARSLRAKGVEVEYVSLCEIRKFKTPEKLFNDTNIPFVNFKKGVPRQSAKPPKEASFFAQVKSEVLRQGFWHGILKPKVKKWLEGTDLIILLNDTAYPGYKIVRYAKSVGIKTFLLQEGIRFPLPVETNKKYGNSGVSHLITWGKKSKEYFETMVAKDTKVVALGSPGFDKSLYFQMPLDSVPHRVRRVGIFGNPVDDQKFISPEEKYALYIDLARALVSYSEKHQLDIEVFFKNHPRESPIILREILKKNGLGHIMVYDSLTDIDIVMNTIDAGIVFASTVGVNLVIHGKKMAVMKLKNYPYLGDYVQDNVAYGLDLYHANIDKQLSEFLADGNEYFANYRRYLDQFASNAGKSDEAIANYIIENR